MEGIVKEQGAIIPTSLSAGAIIRSLLLADEAVASRAGKVFPVAIDTSAELALPPHGPGAAAAEVGPPRL